jgi:hypothetical protein
VRGRVVDVGDLGECGNAQEGVVEAQLDVRAQRVLEPHDLAGVLVRRGFVVRYQHADERVRTVEDGDEGDLPPEPW